MENNPRVGLGVIIVKEGKVLVGKRIGSHGAGTWCFPGGHLDFGESWEECARRETDEEAGIRIKNVRFATATNDIFPIDGKHYVTIIMVAEYDAGDVINNEPDKCERWDWFDWDELPQPLFLATQNLYNTGFRPSFE
ncbi:MAG: NUDIX hydrolase [Patescibacteria group bacterium]